MASEYFIIFDKGDNWEITDTMIVPDGFEVSDDGVLDMSDNKELFEYVKNRLESNSIQFSKDIEGRFVKEDLIIIPYDITEIKRQRYITKGKEYLNSRIAIPEVFSFVEFVILNNKLLEKGYIVTDNNRHEKYLEIVETGDLDLIETLEDFLEARDNIMTKYSWFGVYKNFINKINRASTTDEMKDIWKDYIQTFE